MNRSRGIERNRVLSSGPRYDTRAPAKLYPVKTRHHYWPYIFKRTITLSHSAGLRGRPGPRYRQFPHERPRYGPPSRRRHPKPPNESAVAKTAHP